MKDKSKLIRQITLIIADIVIINISGMFALITRFDFKCSSIPLIYIERYLDYAVINTVITIVVFAVFKLYSSLWRYASEREGMNMCGAVAIAEILHTIISSAVGYRLPISCYILEWMCLLMLVCLERFSYRIIRLMRREITIRSEKSRVRVMVVGAGEAGNTIIKELKMCKYIECEVTCVIDDDVNKKGRSINGVKIVGNVDYIPEAVKKYNITHIFVAMPSVGFDVRKRILGICSKTGCELKTLPGMYQLLKGDVSVSKLRKVKIEDLLGRVPVNTKIGNITAYLNNKVVLVTGGGGSIGSELCRQIAQSNPRKLIILDIYENSVYDIQQELKREFKELDLIVLIGSVRNTSRMEYIFSTYRPDIVYHAAAHKHVPLMEYSPCEAIKNNVFGTLKTAQMADKYGTKRFVMISTDKAVNPTNIMGASKRICEMIVQTFNRSSKTEYVAVRFGNVLGSNGSVIPLFRKQIEEGGPVTVTHPNIIRYFMTIPEAVSLVLEAGSVAKGGEIFVLDMGEPVKIVDLAENLIRLSGYKPYEDIKIIFTGLRPGEKLFEEMLMSEEGLKETSNHRIRIGRPLDIDEREFKRKLESLNQASVSEYSDIKELVKSIVPEYVPDTSVEWKKSADEAAVTIS